MVWVGLDLSQSSETWRKGFQVYMLDSRSFVSKY